jgi:ketosteroid isomerase-like protein
VLLAALAMAGACVAVVALVPSRWARPAVAQAGPDPSVVVNGFEQARNQRDVDATLALFADDATLTDRTQRVYRGRDEIRGYFQQLAARGRGLTLATVNVRVNGQQVSWTERPPTQNGGGFEIGVDAVIRDGKIRSMVYTSSTALAAQRLDPNQDGRSSFPALIGLVAVLLTLAGAAAVLSAAGNGPIPGRESHLRGRLVAELATWRADQHRSLLS